MSQVEGKVFVCGTCGNRIQRLDSLQLHLIFTAGCNKLTKSKFPTCNCGTTYESRAEWNAHSCPGKKAIATAVFDRMVEAHKDCYHTESGSIARPRINSLSPRKSTPKTTPAKKTPKKSTSKKETKKKEKKKDKKKKKNDKKKSTKSDEESTISINEDSDTLSDTTSSDYSSSGSSDSSSEESGKKKRKSIEGDQADQHQRKKKITITEDNMRQWKLMVAYSKQYEYGIPQHTLSQQSMAELEIVERPGSISFLKKYEANTISPLYGFAKREILKFVEGESRMFICRDPDDPESINGAIEIINEHKPRIIKLWQEDKELRDRLVSVTPYFWVDSLVTPSGNIVGVYTLDQAVSPPNEKDFFCYMVLPFSVVVPQEFVDLVVKYEDSMVPLYSVNNVVQPLWKGFALKGYSPSHKVLHKPEEMPKEWQKEHSISNTQSYEADLQETDLMLPFKYYLTQLKKAIPGKKHRIKVLSLLPGGKIGRHSDKPLPPDLNAGKILMRYHVPLSTNENVKMSVLNLHGDTVEFKMEVGYIYIIDNRKPHWVVNDGETTRHHLVFDVEYNAEMEPLIQRAFKVSDNLEDLSAKFNAWKESTEFTKIELVENEEEKAQGEVKRLEKERKKQEEEEEKERERKCQEESNAMILDKIHSPSQPLFPEKNGKANEMDSEETHQAHFGTPTTTGNPSGERALRSSSRSTLLSLSDKFDSSSSSNEDQDEEKNGSHKKNSGKKGTRTSNASAKGSKSKKEKRSSHGASSKAQEFVTIDSDYEEENVKSVKGDGYVATSLEDFLSHYSLSHMQEAFTKNNLGDKLSNFELLGRQDLKDLGFVLGDILLWKKFNPSI